jgi:hypothetical protein
MSDHLAVVVHQTTGTALPRGRGWRSTRSALYLAHDLDFAEWQRLGRRVALVADSASWWIGDWLVFGQHHFPGRYRAAGIATGLDYQTLRNYAWVVSRFAPSRRRDTLSFGHHAEVASLSEDDQDAWLRRALVERWSRNELRRRLRAARTGARDEATPTSIELAVPPQRRQLWEAAACAEGCDLAAWIELVLDRAAESVLSSSPVAA